MLIEAPSTKEKLFHYRVCSPVRRRGSTEEFIKDNASKCVAFLLNATWLAQKTSFALQQGSIVEVWDAKRTSFRLLSIKILNNVEDIWFLETKIRNSDIVLVCLRVIAGLCVGWTHVLHNILRPGYEEGRTMPLLKCNAEAQYGLYPRNKRIFGTHKTGHHIWKVTQLERFSLRM